MAGLREHTLQMWKFAPAQRDHIPAFRIAVSVAVPLLLLVWWGGHPELSIFAAFGAFTALYARNEPRALRFRHQSQAGLLFIACIALGLLLSALAASTWLIIAVCALVGGLCAVAGLYWGLRPPGPLFFIFASAAIGSLPYNGQWLLSLAIAVAFAGFSVVLGFAASWIGEGLHVSQPVPPLHPLGHAQILEQGAVYAAVPSTSKALPTRRQYCCTVCSVS